MVIFVLPYRDTNIQKIAGLAIETLAGVDISPKLTAAIVKQD